MASSFRPAPGAQEPDPSALVRRIAATIQLAAQEYALGVRDGKVVAPAEVDEARLFLTEAGKTAGRLPAPGSADVKAGISRMLALVLATAPADSVAGAAHAVIAGLGSRYQIALDDVPDQTPSLARGAAVYQTTCARCHGGLGRGDGADGSGLDPAPTNLADATALADVSPLDFYRRITVGTAGTAMPAYEGALTPEDRWAVALYASTLRLPAASGSVPPALTTFATTARLSDAELIAALGGSAGASRVAAVRAAAAAPDATPGRHGLRFGSPHRGGRGGVLAAWPATRRRGRPRSTPTSCSSGSSAPLRARDAGLAGEAEAAFAALRTTAETGGPAFEHAERDLDAVLERAERLTADRPSPINLFLQSFILLLREGLEAILVVGALMAFLVKTGAGHRRRDIHLGVGAAIAVSLRHRLPARDGLPARRRRGRRC